MGNAIKAVISVLLFFSATCAQGQMGMNITNEQRECLDGKIGRPGDAPGGPSDEMEEAFRSCGVEPPSAPPPGGNGDGRQAPSENGERPRVANRQAIVAPSSADQAGDVFESFRARRNRNNTYIRLDGKIPRECVEKISVEMSCSEQNKLSFSINELAEDGFECLEENKCENDSSECLSFDELSRSSENYSVRLDSDATDRSCQSLDISSTRVSVLKEAYNPNAQTEAGFCVTCDSSNHQQIVRLEQQIKDLRDVVEEQNQKLSELSLTRDNNRRRSRNSESEDRSLSAEPNGEFASRPQQPGQFQGNSDMSSFSSMSPNGSTVGMNSMGGMSLYSILSYLFSSMNYSSSYSGLGGSMYSSPYSSMSYGLGQGNTLGVAATSYSPNYSSLNYGAGIGSGMGSTSSYANMNYSFNGIGSSNLNTANLQNPYLGSSGNMNSLGTNAGLSGFSYANMNHIGALNNNLGSAQFQTPHIGSGGYQNMGRAVSPNSAVSNSFLNMTNNRVGR